MGTSASRSATASVSAGIAYANAHLPQAPKPGPRFPGEDGGRSLAEMAHRDLDAALQLLAERAQYITRASGAAIALRRGQHNDMLCRASTGSNAPELGALLSMEYGLSGECARTRLPLRCDDAERDARVNHEVCRQLGIASVVVMPIVSEEQVLGVFELFSGKPRAFDERDLSALQRLSEMVETAVKHAATMPPMPKVQEPVAEPQPSGAGVVPRAAPPSSGTFQAEVVLAPPEKVPLPELEATELEKPKPEPAPRKPLFWSAAMQSQGSAARPDESRESITVPLGLRNLQKCQACGFPVSQGRTFCVECEEKQWRGQLLPQPAAGAGAAGQEPRQDAPDEAPQASPVLRAAPDAPGIPALQNSSSAMRSSSQSAAAPSIQTAVRIGEPANAELAIPAPADMPQADVPQNVPQNPPGDVSNSGSSVPFLSSTQESESWFAANKYILGALLVVAIVIGTIAWLH